MHIRLGFLSLSLVLGGLVGSASAVTAWDESVDGDLSSSAGAPTAVAFVPGSNLVQGTTTSSGSPADTRDYLTFSIPANYGLYRLKLVQWDDVPSGEPGNTGFNAINAGATSFIPSGGTIGSFLGANHVDGSYIGTDMLDDIAAAPFGGSGFSIPLGQGTYTYLVQQTGEDIDAYTLDFVVLRTPEPTTLMLGLLGLVGMCGRRRSR